MRTTHTTRTDAKIDRILASWLGVDRRIATWIASVADEFVVPAGADLDTNHFVYVPLDRAHTGVVVTPVSPITFACPTNVLAIRAADVADVTTRVPVLAAATDAVTTPELAAA